MNEAKVSVIIPTYKRTWEYLHRAVQSISAQSYSNFEIIVVDDSPSNYEYRADIQKHMKIACNEDSRVKYIQNEQNIGGSLSRNRGIDSSTGEFITFLDDDDEYLPFKIEHQLRFMLEHDCDLSFENMTMYNTNGDVIDFREYTDIDSYDNEYLWTYHLMKHLTGTPTFMFKAKSLKRIGGFEDAKMGQEFYLMLKSIERGLQIRYLPICDIKVYKHSDGGISQGKNKILGEKALYRFKRKYFKKLNMHQKMFIRFRHFAVMVVAYNRNHMYIHAAGAAIAAFASSPIDFFVQVVGYFKRIYRERG